MPSFDIVSRVELQEIDNAINNVKKEIQTRFDFRGATAELELNKKDKKLTILVSDEMKLKAMREMLIGALVKRKVEPSCLEYGTPEGASHGCIRVVADVKEGIDKDTARKITGLIKNSKLKVQAAIQDEQVRVTGKKIDDLQAVMQLVRDTDLGMPVQFINMKN